MKCRLKGQTSTEVKQLFLIGRFNESINDGSVDLFDRLHAAHYPQIWGKRWHWPLFVNHMNAVVEHGVCIAIWRRTLIKHRVPASHDPVSAQVTTLSLSCKHNMPCMDPHLCSIAMVIPRLQSAKGDVKCSRKIPALLARKSKCGCILGTEAHFAAKHTTILSLDACLNVNQYHSALSIDFLSTHQTYFSFFPFFFWKQPKSK